MGLPAIITAGDRRAAKAVYGESKVFLEVAGEPLVARVVDVLQSVPEVTEVWVVGNAERLDVVFDSERRARLTKPLHILEQYRNLFENCWETFRHALPDAGPDGRDPESEAELDFQVLYLSGDLPFATPQEISEFIRRSQQTGADYACGLVPQESLVDFLPVKEGGAGIEVAYFNMREGRLRQSNLHLARPARMGARELIEEMYEHRHQKKVWNMVTLGLELLFQRGGGAAVLYFYLLVHFGGLADRWGWKGVANWFRSISKLSNAEWCVGRLLQTQFRFVITELGGCALDVDTEEEYDSVNERFHEWTASQEARAKALYGTLSLAEGQASGADDDASELG